MLEISFRYTNKHLLAVDLIVILIFIPLTTWGADCQEGLVAAKRGNIAAAMSE